MKTNHLYHGDCLEVMKKFEDNSVDLIVTDPPYGYDFMGKDWDKVVMGVEYWKECLRVLKPGAFAFVMSAPRQDVLSRAIVNLQDAGFDTSFSFLSWCFASGFPKSLNIAKNIGKMIMNICDQMQLQLGANIVIKNLQDAQANSKEGVTIVVKNVDISTTHMKLNADIVHKKSDDQTVLKSVELSVTSDAMIYQCEKALSKIKGEEVSKIELGNVRSLKEQDINVLCVELIEGLKLIILNQLELTQHLDTTLIMGNVYATIATTTESTKECLITSMVNMLEKKLKESVEHLNGSYGGAQMKPAFECIIVAMKPLSEKTYVDQALKNGKGITWLDDCRIPYESEGDKKDGQSSRKSKENFCFTDGAKTWDRSDRSDIQGRFPANLLVSDDVLNDGVVTQSTQDNTSHEGNKGTSTFAGDKQVERVQRGDSGSFSRYFSLDSWAKEHIKWAKTFPFAIIPKEAKAEKNKYLKGEEKQTKGGGGMGKDPNKPNAFGSVKAKAINFHPTVKPIKLGCYLVTLGSREGDIILDPFCGSGTFCLSAKKLNREYIGVEMDKEYYNIAKERVENEPDTLL